AGDRRRARVGGRTRRRRPGRGDLRAGARAEPGARAPFVEAQLSRFDAHWAARNGDAETAEQRFQHATALLREIGARLWLAVLLLVHFEALIPNTRTPTDLRAQR